MSSTDLKFRPDDGRVFAAKLAILALVSAACGVWIVACGSWLWALPAQAVLGVMFAHAIELQHQTLHGTGLYGRRKNHIAGVLLGLPLLVSFSRYQALHLWHHRHLGTPEDSEMFEYPAREFEDAGEEGMTYGSLLLSAVNVRRWVKVLGDLVGAWWPGRSYEPVIRPPVHGRIRREYRLMGMVLVALGGLSVALSEPLIVSLWAVPMLFAEPVHFLIELPEHVFCDRRDLPGSQSEKALRGTRTISGSWFSFWLTNGNNFHTEHHLRAGVPIHKVPAFHRQIRDQLSNYVQSYPAFYIEVARRASLR